MIWDRHIVDSVAHKLEWIVFHHDTELRRIKNKRHNGYLNQDEFYEHTDKQINGYSDELKRLFQSSTWEEQMKIYQHVNNFSKRTLWPLMDELQHATVRICS